MGKKFIQEGVAHCDDVHTYPDWAHDPNLVSKDLQTRAYWTKWVLYKPLARDWKDYCQNLQGTDLTEEWKKIPGKFCSEVETHGAISIDSPLEKYAADAPRYAPPPGTRPGTACHPGSSGDVFPLKLMRIDRIVFRCVHH